MPAWPGGRRRTSGRSCPLEHPRDPLVVARVEEAVLGAGIPPGARVHRHVPRLHESDQGDLVVRGATSHALCVAYFLKYQMQGVIDVGYGLSCAAPWPRQLAARFVSAPTRELPGPYPDLAACQPWERGWISTPYPRGVRHQPYPDTRGIARAGVPGARRHRASEWRDRPPASPRLEALDNFALLATLSGKAAELATARCTPAQRAELRELAVAVHGRPTWWRPTGSSTGPSIGRPGRRGC